MDVVIAAVVGLLLGSVANRLIVREPGYVIRNPADLPDDADPALLDELEEVGELPDVPVLAVLRPRTWSRRWFPVVELVMAVAVAAAVARYGVDAVGIAVTFLMVALVTLAAVDFRVLRIPDRLNFPAMVVGFGLIVVVSFVEDVPETIVGAVLGGLFYAGFLYLAHIVYPKGMGWGDVKLAWLMGFYLGWFGYRGDLALGWLLGPLRLVLYGAGLGSVLGLLVGLPYAIAGRSTRAAFPYGPSLAAGCAVVVLFATELR